MLPSNKSNKTRNKGILDAINEGFLTGVDICGGGKRQ
jgi:hypothetical protein